MSESEPKPIAPTRPAPPKSAGLERSVEDATEAVAVGTRRLEELSATGAGGKELSLAQLSDVPIPVTVQLGRVRLIDARAPERFRGEVEPLDKAAGHIPGASNRLFKDNLQADGRFKPAEQLRPEFEPLLAPHAAETVVHQCGSGVTACHNLLAMAHAGLGEGMLYPGSWSEWSADPARPLAKG